MSVALLSAAEQAGLSDSLPLWIREPDRAALHRAFRFADFSAAWAFMTRVALAAHALDHHPEWSNVYDQVDITLTTHRPAGLTAKDVALARAIDAFAP